MTESTKDLATLGIQSGRVLRANIVSGQGPSARICLRHRMEASQDLFVAPPRADMSRFGVVRM
jgi:hypothetical protein